LVGTFGHLFARWDDPHGEKFNIECTSRGFVSHPDDWYLEWPRPVTPDLAKRTNALQSLTRRQELAESLVLRGHVCLENQLFAEAVEAYANAWELHNTNETRLTLLAEAMNRWERHLQKQLMPGFPALRITSVRGRYPSVPAVLERGIHHLQIKDALLTNDEL